MSIIKEIQLAAKGHFHKPLNVVTTIGFAFLIFWLFVMVPVWTTPGDDFLFQLSLFTPSIYAILISLSLLNGYLLSMHFALYRMRHDLKVKTSKKEKLSIFGIIGSSIAATAGCASCYSSLLAVFGLGGSVFIVEHRFWFALIAFGLTSYAIYATSKRLNGHCSTCHI